MSAESWLKSARAELDKIARDIDQLIQAITDGVPSAQVKDKMAALEERKTELQDKLQDTD